MYLIYVFTYLLNVCLIYVFFILNLYIYYFEFMYLIYVLNYVVFILFELCLLFLNSY